MKFSEELPRKTYLILDIQSVWTKEVLYPLIERYVEFDKHRGPSDLLIDQVMSNDTTFTFDRESIEENDPWRTDYDMSDDWSKALREGQKVSYSKRDYGGGSPDLFMVLAAAVHDGLLELEDDIPQIQVDVWW